MAHGSQPVSSGAPAGARRPSPASGSAKGPASSWSTSLEVDAYFPLEVQRTDVRAPLTLTEMGGRVDVFVNVQGSGKHSQSGAVLLGLARALKEFRPDLEPALRDAGFLTRDARMVERKKYGHKKARKSFQFSKR